MVKAKDSCPFQMHSACDLPNLNCMSKPFQQGQQNVVPSPINRCTFPPDVSFLGFSVPGLSGPGPAQANGTHGLVQFLPPPRLGSLPSTFNPYVKEEPSALYYGHGVKAIPNALPGSIQKKFVIFDQSGNHTRLFISPLCSPVQNLISAPMQPVGAYDLRDEGQPAKVEQNFPTKPTFQENSNEDQVIGEGGEMHEDTDEINALLYSDDDGYDSEEEDEVTSTDRSPFAIEDSYKKRECREEIKAESANPETPTKRQRLVDGVYKKSSSANIVSLAKLERFCDCCNNAESSCAKGGTQGEDFDCILGSKQLRKAKIRDTLKILESVIPGLKSKDPLLVIEDAISYLQYLKLKARALGVT